MDAENVPYALSLDHKPERIIKKVPGNVPRIPTEKCASMGDLSKCSIADLRELLERQNKILSNKLLLSKLSDKGKKVTDLKRKIEEELKCRDDVDKAADLLSEMSLTQLHALEWTGHCNPGRLKDLEANYLEHEENNPLRIFASHSGTTDQMKQIKFLKEEDSLIKPQDLVDSKDKNVAIDIEEESTEVNEKSAKNQATKICESLVSGEKNEREEKSVPPSDFTLSAIPKQPLLNEPEPFAHLLCSRYGHKDSKERFKLNKPLKPFTGTFPFKAPGRVSTKPKRWEETNVTPPPALHSDTKLLSLEESIDIQCEQSRKLKEIQIKHAAEKLASLHNVHLTEEIPAGVLANLAYRSSAETNSDSEDELKEVDLDDQELHDEDELDRGGTIVYRIDS